MQARRFHRPGVTLLAATVLVLLPALAWLQYSWLDQIAMADRERRERTLKTTASQLAADLDGELGRAFMGLQIDSTIAERHAWESYAHRYRTWASSAVDPDVVDAIYLVELPDDRDHGHASSEPATLRRWTSATATFDPVAWPSDLATLEERVRTPALRFDFSGHRGDRDRDRPVPPPLALGDERTLVAPIIRVDDEERAAASKRTPDVRVLGFTVLRLNLDVVRHEVLPALVRRHFFDADGTGEYRVAVVQRDHPEQVVYESEPGIAAAVLAQPDASTTLMAARLRPTIFMARRDQRDAAAADPPKRDENVVFNVFEMRRERGRTVQTRMMGSPEGHWRLVAKHRAGSLEAAVAATRARNFGLSTGILALLATTIGLIVVLARRADRLAQQQMEFVAAVSHELRTPVAVIGAAAGNLADGVVGDPERVKRYGSTIQGEARRLTETVERVLQLAGIAAGRAAAAAVEVPPRRIVAEAVDACRGEIEKNGLELEVDISDALPPVAGDAAALKAAVQNLVANAVKYARDGGWIRVSAREVSARLTSRPWVPWALAARTLSARAIAIVVEDRGPGIAASDREHIFEPFYRGRDAIAQQIPGSGLGLNLVKRIAEAHAGTIAVTTDPGRGTKFTLTLPASTDRTVPARDTTALRQTAPGAPRAL